MTTKSAGRLYIVKAADTLAGIARRAYGNGMYYSVIAEANELSETLPLYEGQQLILPPLRTTSQGVGLLPDLEEIQITGAAAQRMTTGAPIATDATSGRIIDEVVVTARKPWWQDWRIWVGAGVVTLTVLYAFSRRSSTIRS